MKESLRSRRFVVFDLETTGLDPARHEIIEIGAVRVNQDADVDDTFQALVKPRKRIPKANTEMTGISQRMVNQEGRSLRSAMEELCAFIEDLPLVSFNAEFDMAFLRNAAKGQNMVIRNPASCALKMARRAWPGRTSYQLGDLAKDRKLSDEGTHRALGDCKRTVLIYAAALSRVGLRRK